MDAMTDKLMPTSEIAAPRTAPGWFVTALWFVFVGSWLTPMWAIAALLCIVTIIGAPLGLLMLNRLPQIATLRPPLQQPDGSAVPQRFWLVRALYFVFVGLWVSLVWMSLAWVFSVTLIGLPLGIWMWNRTPAVTTLAKY